MASAKFDIKIDTQTQTVYNTEASDKLLDNKVDKRLVNGAVTQEVRNIADDLSLTAANASNTGQVKVTPGQVSVVAPLVHLKNVDPMQAGIIVRQGSTPGTTDDVLAIRKIAYANYDDSSIIAKKDLATFKTATLDPAYLAKSGGTMSGVITSPTSPTASTWAHAIDGANGSGELSFSTQTQDARLMSMHNLYLGASNEITLDAKDIKIVLETGGTRGNTSVAMLGDITSAVGAYVKKAGDTMSGNLNMGGKDLTNAGNVFTNGLANKDGDFLIDLSTWDSGGIKIPVELDMGGSTNRKQIHNVAAPTAANDAATKGYVDGAIPTGVNQTADLQSTTPGNSLTGSSIGVKGILPVGSGGTGTTAFGAEQGLDSGGGAIDTIMLINRARGSSDTGALIAVPYLPFPRLEVGSFSVFEGIKNKMDPYSTREFITNLPSGVFTGTNAPPAGWCYVKINRYSNTTGRVMVHIQQWYSPFRNYFYRGDSFAANVAWNYYYDTANPPPGGATPVNGTWNTVPAEIRDGSSSISLTMPSGTSKVIISLGSAFKGSFNACFASTTIIPPSSGSLAGGLSGVAPIGDQMVWVTAPFNFNASSLSFANARVWSGTSSYTAWKDDPSDWFIKIDYM